MSTVQPVFSITYEASKTSCGHPKLPPDSPTLPGQTRSTRVIDERGSQAEMTVALAAPCFGELCGHRGVDVLCDEGVETARLL